MVHICDGDTYDLLVDGKAKKRIRILGIDAPEKGQDFSRKATDYLKQLCYHKTVVIRYTEVDRYGRLLAVTTLPDGKDVGEEMTKAGFAWCFEKFSTSFDLRKSEAMAKSQKNGLWKDPHPVEPWIERTLRKKGYNSQQIKQLKIEGKLNTEEDAKKMPRIKKAQP